MSVVAAARPDEWNLALLVHVAGAMILVGGLLASLGALVHGRRAPTLLGLGYLSLVAVALPGWVLMRAGGQWIASEEGWSEARSRPLWLELGAAIADLGGVVLLVALVAGGAGLYRFRRGGGTALLTAALALSLALLPAYLLAAWAMAGKPG